LGDQPGILAQGPDEKCGIAGRNAGFVVDIRIAPSLQMDRPSVGRASPERHMPELRARINYLEKENGSESLRRRFR
jgi:hypothetical protein